MLAEKQLDKINIYDIYKSVNIGDIYYEDICDGEEKIMITIPKSLIHDMDMVTTNRSEFIRASVKERIRKEKERLMAEGYLKEKNLNEWEATAGDGIE